MFTLEIDGKPVAITNADEDQAQELFGSEDFREDLKQMTSEGRPLWNGTSALTVRPASEDEIDEFDEALSEDEETEEDEAEEGEEEDEEDSVDILFLVPVDESDEEE